MQRNSTEGSGKTHGGPERCVLVADDDAAFRADLCGYLRDLGLRVVEAENGLAALEAIKRSEPCVVFLDIRMPGMDGLEVVERAKPLAPDAKIVVMSGYMDEVRRANMISAGAFWVLEKPLPLKVVGRFAQDIYWKRAPTGGARQRAA